MGLYWTTSGMVKHTCSLQRGYWQGQKKNLMKQKNEQSNKGRTGEPADFVFDVPFHPW